MRVNCLICGRYIDEGGSGETVCCACQEVRRW